MEVDISIPNGINFEDLNVRLHTSGQIEFEREPFDAVVKASSLGGHIDQTIDPDVAAAILVAWYLRHKKNGGEQNLVLEYMLEKSEASKASASASPPTFNA